MAEASISVDQDQFSCPVCLDLLKDPVGTPCGHSFCKKCINKFWDAEAPRRIYSCPQCRETFTPRPFLQRNIMLAEVVEKLIEHERQAASSAHSYAGPGDVECDFCIGRKHKAVKSCLVCLASYCEDHLEPHYQSPAFKKHKLVEACAELQKKICSEHDKVMEIYCRTDQSFICYLCIMDEHRGHSTVALKTERAEQQTELKKLQLKSLQRIQDKQMKVEELKQNVDIIKRRSQAAVDDSEGIYTELISYIEKKRSETRDLIRAREKAELSRTERLLNYLEKEIAELKRRVTKMEQLSDTPDHIHFLQNFPSLCVSPEYEDSPNIAVTQDLSFNGVRTSLSDLKEQVQDICEEEFGQILTHGPSIWIIGDSYVRRGEDRARETMGTNLGLNAKVQWFGRVGMQWQALIPFFYQSLNGRSVPDILVVHCGSNDLGCLRSLELVAAMKKDLHDLHHQFPQMKIVLSSITQRHKWKSASPRTINKARKWVNNVMATFVLDFEGAVVDHPDITFHTPGLFLSDGVNFTSVGNDIFLNDFFHCLKSFIY